ncbi:virulence factor [Celeribacter litoreus]|uniref:virulence factor n=1 Tax=Celeribacter litoreus TaxID=2876714 RepID=UPI001CCB7165|nr:virulence factor [Celeribacter litoreus]MCA0043778.1 virulence factor [Celeribacter litoreus]
MPAATSDLTVIYWRDIPAQVRVGRGRRAARAVLPERFEQAIDRVAMKIGATDGDAYMAEWRDVIETCEGAPQEAADARAAALDAEYDKERLIALVNNEGREPAHEDN